MNASIISESPLRKKMTEMDEREKIEHVINEWSRPFMKSEGGDLSIERVSGTVVYVRLHGVCAGCAAAAITLQYMVEEPLQSFVNPDIRVISI
ncbi:NifU family protein [Kiritimatiellota bacterium B12222]|nr:NifU family protein [Kiritimatiellota bacterium B12222]